MNLFVQLIKQFSLSYCTLIFHIPFPFFCDAGKRPRIYSQSKHVKYTSIHETAQSFHVHITSLHLFLFSPLFSPVFAALSKPGFFKKTRTEFYFNAFLSNENGIYQVYRSLNCCTKQKVLYALFQTKMLFQKFENRDFIDVRGN